MFLYTLVVLTYGLLIRLSGFRNRKAKQWVEGRKNWRNNLNKALSNLASGKRIWVHCASYGEFEQGRPLIEGIKLNYPHYKIILSFFSPSGYEAFKNWDGADVVCYLPLDTKANAHDFIQSVNPNTAIFIKYEFWVNFLFELKKRNIPTYLVSAVFKAHHPFFKWYGGLFRRSLLCYTKLFIQDEASGTLLKSIGITMYEVSGDTRFDRVSKIKESHIKNDTIIIAGSTWPGDEDLVMAAFDTLRQKNVKLLIAPHEIGEKSLENTIKKLQQKGLTYSRYKEDASAANKADVLILNTIGQLAQSYYYADCAYIGGGFEDGLHNLLEPAVFGIPVSFYGKDYIQFNEAIELINRGSAASVKNHSQLKEVLDKHLFDEAYRTQTKIDLATYFSLNANAADKVLDAIKF
jgi:3-deoxy-D-manno-octulosonic-acid transferase